MMTKMQQTLPIIPWMGGKTSFGKTSFAHVPRAFLLC